MALIHTSNEYQIPRGRLYWDPRNALDALTGEEEFGNCPSFSISIETEKLEHFSSQTGLREKDDSRVVQVNRTATVTCDVPTSDLGVPGVRASYPIRATATSPVDTYRQRA